jgi:hypothetical protein
MSSGFRLLARLTVLRIGLVSHNCYVKQPQHDDCCQYEYGGLTDDEGNRGKDQIEHAAANSAAREADEGAQDAQSGRYPTESMSD